MKRFSILSAMLCVALATLACGPWTRPMYYVFSAYDRQMMDNERFAGQFKKFWVDYTGKEEAGWDMSSLWQVNLQEFNKSENTIVECAVQKKDKEMQEYLRLLISYLKESEKNNENGWDYPTKAQRKKSNQQYEYMFNRARSYKGTRLKSQYALIAIRTLMAQGKWNEVIQYWTKANSALPEDAYKNYMRNIYAGALLRTGKTQEACDIYAQQGDMGSLKWIMRNGRNLKGIKQEYQRDPNAPTLIYLVQDFVNNGDQTLHKQYEYDWDNPAYKQAYRNEAQQFVDFALDVVKQGKTKSPALWQSAAGYLTHELGDTKKGIDMLSKAMKMNGTQRMKDNARVCRWVASLAIAENNNKFSDEFLTELKWVKSLVDDEVKDNGGAHYLEVLQNMMYDRLPVVAQKWNNTNLATASVAWMSQQENNWTRPELRESIVSGDLWPTIDNLTAQEMTQYWDFLKKKDGNNSLERYLNTGMNDHFCTTYFNDQIGTKHLREGHYETAIPYLEKVPLDFISQQGISTYMARRDYNVEMWFKRQKVYTGDFWSWEPTPQPVKSNQKLDFCQQILGLQQRHDNAQGNARAQVAYQLATLFYQASYKGNCWYISRYANSVYDTVCYKNEKDFVAEAAMLLDEAVSLAGNDWELKQKALYANAYIDFGEPYYTISYDSDYHEIRNLNPNSRQYNALMDLSNFLDNNGSNTAPYILKCDVLKKFRKQL